MINHGIECYIEAYRVNPELICIKAFLLGTETQVGPTFYITPLELEDMKDDLPNQYELIKAILNG